MDVIRKILDLLTPRERTQLYLLLPAVTLMGLMEVAGIASIAPFLGVVTDPSTIQTNPILAWLYDALGVETERRFMLILGLMVLAVLAVGNAIGAATFWALYRFGNLRNHTISRRLLERYLEQPYSFFLSRNSADLINNILAEVTAVIDRVVIPGLQIVAKSVAVLLIVALLVAVNPFLALVVTTLLGGAYGAIYLAIRLRLSRLGSERVEANRSRLKATNEAIGGIKELKLLGREHELLDQYDRPSYKFAVANATTQILGMLPRYALETVAFGGVLIILLVLIGTGGTTAQVIPIVGLYAFAGYRLLPALQVIFSGMTQLRYGMPSVDEVHAILQRIDEKETPIERRASLQPLPFEDELRLDHVWFTYENTEEGVLRDISLTIQPNTSVAFVGETGSGKTTAADLILGLLEPSQGTISVDGRSLQGPAVRRWQRNIGYVPQHIYLADDSIARNIAFGIPARDVDQQAVERAAEIAQIHDFIEGLPEGYQTMVGDRGIRLSGGQRQRLGIARAVYHDPKVLVLDEATSALDNVTEANVFRTLEEIARTKTVVLIAHRLSTVSGCDTIHVLHSGRLEASGTYDELLVTNPRFRRMVDEAGAAKPAAEAQV